LRSCFLRVRRPPSAALFPYTTLFRSVSGSDLVTNFHVVAEALATGFQTVDVVQADRTLKGTVVRTDRTDDLAVVHVQERLAPLRSEEHTSELQSLRHLVCRLLLEKKN